MMRRMQVTTLVAVTAVMLTIAPGQAFARAKAAKEGNASARAEAKAQASAAELARATETFTPFCEAWMGKLAQRESENLSKREWKANGNGYLCTYVGYSKEHGCTVSNDGQVPVGRVLYREVTYQQEGSTLDEAKGCEPRPIEIYEVTELFRFNKGKWTTD